MDKVKKVFGFEKKFDYEKPLVDCRRYCRDEIDNNYCLMGPKSYTLCIQSCECRILGLMNKNVYNSDKVYLEQCTETKTNKKKPHFKSL